MVAFSLGRPFLTLDLQIARRAVTGNWKCIKMCITSATIWSKTSKKIICLLHLHTVIQQSWIEEKPSFRGKFIFFTSFWLLLPAAAASCQALKKDS